MNKQKTRRPELLAPAGNMEKFFTALHFGADAVYLAGKNFGLRAFADNFTLDEIKFCCGYAHEKGKKVYVTVNIFADGRDLEKLPDYISALDNCGADALIVSDAGVMQIAKSVAPRLPLHLSTQANCTNARAAEFWRDAGVSRIVAARECGFDDLVQMAALKDCELEIFVHGAMCMAYSGRCLLAVGAGRQQGRVRAGLPLGVAGEPDRKRASRQTSVSQRGRKRGLHNEQQGFVPYALSKQSA